MLQEIQKIERNIKDRREIDVPLMNWWLYLLVNGLTGGIYGIVKRNTRVREFAIRKYDYYQNVITYTEKLAQEINRYDEVRNELNDLKTDVDAAFRKNMQLRKCTTMNGLMLTIVTVGIFLYVWFFRLNKFWYDAQKIEQDFDDKLSQIWLKLGLIKYPLNFSLDASKNRNFWMQLLLSIVTVGVWILIWDYKIHTDPDNLYKEFHAIEDSVLQTVRQGISK